MRNETFGWRLKRLRMDLGLRQEDLRDEMIRAGTPVGISYISELERSDKIPSGQVAAAFAKILGTTTDYLLLLSDDPMPPAQQEAITYISPEADEVARLVDAMPAQARRDLLTVAQYMVESAAGMSPRVQDIKYLLQVAEGLFGVDGRRRLEMALLRPYGGLPDANG